MIVTKERAVHVGAPPADFNRKVEDSQLVHFHDFAQLSREIGEGVESPEFTCAGYRWKLTLYLGGQLGQIPQFGNPRNPCVWLRSMNNEEIWGDFGIGVKQVEGSAKELTWFELDKTYSTAEPHHRLNLNQHIINHVPTDGTLTLGVYIRLRSHKTVNEPERCNLMKAFLDKDDADLSFKIKGQIFPAHRIILKCRAPELAELSESFDSTNPMPINDVDPSIFCFMLSMVYGKSVDAKEWKDQSANLESILKAAGKYGFVNVKAEAENQYLRSIKLDIDNVINNLLNADAYDLPLVKNSAIKFILDYAGEVVASESYAQLNESPPLMKEVMTAMGMHIKQLSDKKRKRDE